ncbi:MAG: threonine/serine exporter family protein [Clostridia bacterium]|nr:threonine/serine exporter family protein [Clostridia bacterium]
MSLIDAIIQIAAAGLGTFGFGILFNLRGKRLWWTSLGGLLGWALFLALGLLMEGEPIRYLIVSICTTVYSEIIARKLKTPVTTACIITLIPLVPGGALYNATTAALSGDMDLFIPRLVHTAELAVAMSLGIVIVTAVFTHLLGKKHK